MVHYQLYHCRGGQPQSHRKHPSSAVKDPATPPLQFLDAAIAQISALEKEVFPELFPKNAPDHRGRHQRNLQFQSNCLFFAGQFDDKKNNNSNHSDKQPWKVPKVVSFLFTTSQAGRVRFTSLGTHPDHRKKGLASRLMVQALAYHKEYLKCSSASLLVRASDLETRRLYGNIPVVPPPRDLVLRAEGSARETSLPRQYIRFQEAAGGILPNYYANGEDAIGMELKSLQGCPPWDPRTSRRLVQQHRKDAGQ